MAAQFHEASGQVLGEIRIAITEREAGSQNGIGGSNLANHRKVGELLDELRACLDA